MQKFLRCAGHCALGFMVFMQMTIPQSASARNLQVKKEVLDNGLTVLVTEMPHNPMVAVYMYVKTGSATEYPYLGSGISHFLEHMLFKGTETRGVGAISA